MKRILFILVTLTFSVIATAQKQIVVDENAEMRSVNGSFHSIMISDGIDLYLSQSDNEEIAVSSPTEKITKEIRTVVEDNVLKIFYAGQKNRTYRNSKIKAYVAFKELRLLDGSGASDIFVTGKLNSGALLLKLSGASDFKGEVEVSTLSIDLSGASDVQVSGTAGAANIESSGASDVKGYDLVVDICNVKVSGASDVSITVNKELTAIANGASGIYYKGAGLLKKQERHGSSTISKRD